MCRPAIISLTSLRFSHLPFTLSSPSPSLRETSRDLERDLKTPSIPPIPLLLFRRRLFPSSPSPSRSLSPSNRASANPGVSDTNDHHIQVSRGRIHPVRFVLPLIISTPSPIVPGPSTVPSTDFRRSSKTPHASCLDIQICNTCRPSQHSWEQNIPYNNIEPV